ncbi:glycosyltransferase family 4 protein [Qipengyuania sediminis]|uniref:glycosyltransferase family 4 protein n=1 Tax=Qipengyuania sediminis TaxID=1532023 RepID=UPI001059F0E4|nr:glycosyltransferase family 4 protein [Qipengyuania sediminis]
MTAPTDGAGSAAGYVLTHYPKLAQTFIAGEIAAVERAGVPLRVFAMNAPEAFELARAGAGEKTARTVYLKPRIGEALGALAAVSLRHPIRMAQVWRKAVASAGGNPARTVRRLAHLAQAALVERIAAREGIDTLHAHFGLAPATIAWLATHIAHARGRTRARFGFTIHGFHDFVEPAETRLDLKARDAAHVLCISDFTRSQLCLGTDPVLWSRYHVARCGVDIAAFPYRDPPPIAGRPRIMALGRLSPEKGFAILIEAIGVMQDEGIDAEVRIVGDGPMRSVLEAQAAALGLADRIAFTGELPPEEVARHLATSDIFCMSSFSEGLPISIMEAMAVGVPVVSTWICGIPELARQGETALTVPPADAAALAAALTRSAGDEALRVRLARAGRKAVEERHDLARCGAAVARHLQRTEP